MHEPNANNEAPLGWTPSALYAPGTVVAASPQSAWNGRVSIHPFVTAIADTKAAG